MLTHQQHRTDGPRGGPITGGQVVPSHWRNTPQGGPMPLAGDTSRVRRRISSRRCDEGQLTQPSVGVDAPGALHRRQTDRSAGRRIETSKQPADGGPPEEEMIMNTTRSHSQECSRPRRRGASRRVVGAVGLAAVLSTSSLAVDVAEASVVSPSGATADSYLVCQRLWGSYTFGTNNRGFDYVATYSYNSESGGGGWSSWSPPDALHKGFALPTRGQVAFYLLYAYWNGSDWEFAGEWAQVTNSRGEVVGYFC